MSFLFWFVFALVAFVNNNLLHLQHLLPLPPFSFYFGGRWWFLVVVVAVI